MNRATSVHVVRAPRRRGTFGLDGRRRPDPIRVEGEILTFLRERLPEVWPLSWPVEPASGGRTIVLLLARGHAAVLRIEPDLGAPSAVALRLAERCRANRIPEAAVTSLSEARAALRRFGIEPRPSSSPLSLSGMIGRCRAKASS